MHVEAVADCLAYAVPEVPTGRLDITGRMVIDAIGDEFGEDLISRFEAIKEGTIEETERDKLLYRFWLRMKLQSTNSTISSGQRQQENPSIHSAVANRAENEVEPPSVGFVLNDAPSSSDQRADDPPQLSPAHHPEVSTSTSSPDDLENMHRGP